MLEAIFLGVRGVLLPRSAFEAAEIEVAAATLGSHGVPLAAFRAAAFRVLASGGRRSLLTSTLDDLGIQLPPAVIRSAAVQARLAVPPQAIPCGFRAVLRDLATRFELGFLDSGPPDVLDALVSRLQLDGGQGRCLWSARLGELARPPRALAFRWLVRRLELRPSACLYVAGSQEAWQAASQAGWKVLPGRPPTRDACIEPWEMQQWIDRLEGME